MPRVFQLHVSDSGLLLYPIRGLLGYCHLLFDKSRHEVVIIDTGLAGEMRALGRVLEAIGAGWGDVRAILLTHGHLDHTGHLAQLKRLTGAPVMAHPAERPHIDGNFPYRGASRVCGALEACGRTLIRYRPAAIDKELSDGMELPYWGGLRVIHLPGHTQGHCGFYSAALDVLFSGDLFASYVFVAHLPPWILNSCPQYFNASLQRIKELSPRRIVPNHYLGFDGKQHRKNFDAMMARRSR